MNWPTPPLGSLVETIVPARDKPVDLNGDIPWVRIEDFEGKYLSGSKSGQGVTDETIKSMPLRVFPEGTVVCSCSCTMGTTAIVTRPLVTNQTFIGLLPRRKGLSSEFLYYALQGHRERLTAAATGAIQTYLSRDDFRSLRIPVPPLHEQRVIADYLDRETGRIDALIAAKQQMVELLEERWRGQRESMLVTDSAPMIRLGRFISSISQGASPQAEARPAASGEWGVLKLSAVKAGRFIPSEHKALPPDFSPTADMVPCIGDLLLTRANTPALVGDVCAVTKAAPRLMLPDLIYRLRLTHDLDPEYAAQALLTSLARDQLSSAARGTSQSMVKLRGEDVKATLIPVPPLDIQHSVVAVLSRARSRLDRALDALAMSVRLLRERREALITAAVTGQLEIPGAA